MGRLASFVRCDWLTAERVRAYSNIILATTLLVAVLRVVMAQSGAGPLGVGLSSDFISFWAASHLALAGHAVDTYDVATHWDVQRAALGDAAIGYTAFLYPPVWLLLCLPLALLPFWWSLATFLGATGAAYWWVTRQIFPRAGTLFLAFPAVAANVIYGQNGMLTTALFGGGLLALRERPWLAGICFGCLAYKPHMAAIVPIALLAGRHWRAVVATAVTAVVLIAASFALFGVAAWRAFWAEAPMARAVLEHGIVTDIGWVSTFRAVVQLGGSVAAAYALQGAVALVAIVILVATCRRRAEAILPMLPLTTLIASPFLLAYDLALLALPMAWLVRQGLAGGFRPWEKPVLCFAFAAPLLSIVASRVGVPVLGPLAMAALFASAAWRCRRDQPGLCDQPGLRDQP